MGFEVFAKTLTGKTVTINVDSLVSKSTTRPEDVHDINYKAMSTQLRNTWTLGVC